MAINPMYLSFLMKGLIQLGTGEVRARIMRRDLGEAEESTSKLADDVDLDALFPASDREELAQARVAGDSDEEGDDLEPLPGLWDGETRLGDSIAPEAARERFPADLFSVMVGLEHEKAVVKQCIVSEDYRFHVLLVGAPGSAKSLFLDLIRNGLSEESRIIVGAQATELGLKKMLLDANHPRLLLFEEIDKAPREVMNGLLTAMDGTVTNTIGTGGEAAQRENLDLQVHVIAAANSTGPLIAPLLDRFTVLHVGDYTEAERHKVMVGLLTKRKGFNIEEATQVADLVAPSGGSVREAERIGILWKADPELAKAQVARTRR